MCACAEHLVQSAQDKNQQTQESANLRAGLGQTVFGGKAKFHSSAASRTCGKVTVCTAWWHGVQHHVDRINISAG